MTNTTTVEKTYRDVEDREGSTPWALVPSIERSYINSEQPKDIERAMGFCQEHGLDYHATRRRIIREMTAEYEANEPARERRRAETTHNVRHAGTQRA